MENVKSKKLLVVVASVVALSVIGAVGFVLTRSNDKQTSSEMPALVADGPCSSRDQGSILVDSIGPFLQSAYKEGAEATTARTNTLINLERRITAEENFAQDPNCLHILTMIYLDRADIQQAEAYLALLEAGLEVANPESYILDENANFKTPEQIRTSIELAKSSQQEAIEGDPTKDANGESITTE